ncbi:hypothetical protein J6590_040126 [Homalodisca vitripennis]|nr:hypothetical protein J6590_040126 [Homalodisca vitripennis]
MIHSFLCLNPPIIDDRHHNAYKTKQQNLCRAQRPSRCVEEINDNPIEALCRLKQFGGWPSPASHPPPPMVAKRLSDGAAVLLLAADPKHSYNVQPSL